MFGQPPVLLPGELVSRWESQVPQLRARTVPDTNHDSILFSPEVAAAVAGLLAVTGARPR